MPNKTPEADFQKTLIQMAQYKGWKIYHSPKRQMKRNDGSTYYATAITADGKGYPDLTMVRKGRLIFSELKTDSGRTSPEQDSWLEELGKCAECFVWRPKMWAEIERTLE